MIKYWPISEAIRKEAERIQFEYNPPTCYNREETKALMVSISELLTVERFGGKLVNTKHYDIIHVSAGTNGVKNDVKYQKITHGVPELWQNATVYTTNLSADVDFYSFMRIHENLKDAWFCGMQWKNEFFAHPETRFYKAGEPDHNGYSSSIDRYILKYQYLR
jgi:hypothetical protein